MILENVKIKISDNLSKTDSSYGLHPDMIKLKGKTITVNVKIDNELCSFKDFNWRIEDIEFIEDKIKIVEKNFLFDERLL